MVVRRQDFVMMAIFLFTDVICIIKDFTMPAYNIWIVRFPLILHA